MNQSSADNVLFPENDVKLRYAIPGEINYEGTFET